MFLILQLSFAFEVDVYKGGLVDHSMMYVLHIFKNYR